MSHRDSPIKKNKELNKPMDIMNVGFVGVASAPTGSAVLVFDNFTEETAQTTASSRSISHTTTDENFRMMIVHITGGGATLNVTSVTYGGVAMTALATGGSGSPYYNESRLFGLVDPPTGTNNVVATQSTSTNMSIKAVLTVYGSKATLASGSLVNAVGGTGNSVTVAVTPTVTGSWVFGSANAGVSSATQSPPSNYFTNAEINALTSSSKKSAYKTNPTINSSNSVHFFHRHPAHTNPVPYSGVAVVLEPHG
jgi:hypothetical protein